MSIAVMSQVWAHSRATARDLLVLLAIADFADDKGVAYPTVKVLARKARMPERTVQAALARLGALGELAVQRGGGNKPSVYQVVVQALHHSTSIGTPGSGAESAPPLGTRAPASAQESALRGTSSPLTGARARARGGALARERSALWDALTEVTQAEPATAGEKSRRGRSVNELLAVGATPDEIVRRGRAYRKKYPGAALTDRALVNHWGEFEKLAVRKHGRECPECKLVCLSDAKLEEHRDVVHGVRAS